MVLEIDGKSTDAADARQIARETIEHGIEWLANPDPYDELALTARAKVAGDFAAGAAR